MKKLIKQLAPRIKVGRISKVEKTYAKFHFREVGKFAANVVLTSKSVQEIKDAGALGLRSNQFYKTVKKLKKN